VKKGLLSGDRVVSPPSETDGSPLLVLAPFG
jgi:hypothetical protein